MSNYLENFINNNREEFDSEEMTKDAWKKLHTNLPLKNKKSQFKIRRFWWAAAAGIVIFSSIAIYFTFFKSGSTNAVAVKTIALPPKEFTDAIDTSYTSQMYSFAYIIRIKQTELKKNEKEHPGLYQQFLKDNNRLDSSYNYLRSQLSANPNKEVLLDAMIQNLQLKIDLLTRQLQIIQQSKHKKSGNENKTI